MNPTAKKPENQAGSNSPFLVFPVLFAPRRSGRKRRSFSREQEMAGVVPEGPKQGGAAAIWKRCQRFQAALPNYRANPRVNRSPDEPRRSFVALRLCVSLAELCIPSREAHKPRFGLCASFFGSGAVANLRGAKRATRRGRREERKDKFAPDAVIGPVDAADVWGADPHHWLQRSGTGRAKKRRGCSL